MKPKDFDAFDKRIEAKARQMWEAAGRPEGGFAPYLDDAKGLLEISENPEAGRISIEESAKPVINTLVDVENQGEFPGLSDQGDKQLFPAAQQTVEVPLPPEAKEKE